MTRDALAPFWARVRAEVGDAGLLFRSIHGTDLARVLETGTDRAGPPPDPSFDWAAAGLRGPPRAWVDCVLASRAAEIDAWLATGRGSCALAKCPDTPDPHLLVYRRAAFAAVGRGVYAFRRPDAAYKRAALRAIFRVEPAGG